MYIACSMSCNFDGPSFLVNSRGLGLSVGIETKHFGSVWRPKFRPRLLSGGHNVGLVRFVSYNVSVRYARSCDLACRDRTRDHRLVDRKSDALYHCSTTPESECKGKASQTPLLRFVVDLSYSLYDKSRTSPYKSIAHLWPLQTCAI